ncbi:GIY-YIG nuclease family protein [Sphingopyxis sp. GW247-27LB]|uniref:GIY-YIG nuclease family protein n=1 Tax=Sphingopyxis sp. GW247-27LB TaxID=2012632 RepID=UPI0034E945AB
MTEIWSENGSISVTPGLTRGLPCLCLPRMERQPCVYILARSSHGTLYTGVTSNLLRRIHQHREGVFDGHTKRYEIKRLVWFERHETMDSAILREKQVKRWLREWKYDLINAQNPTWRDLAEDFGFDPLPLGQRKAGPGSSPG